MQSADDLAYTQQWQRQEFELSKEQLTVRLSQVPTTTTRTTSTTTTNYYYYYHLKPVPLMLRISLL